MELKMTLKRALEVSPELKRMYDTDPVSYTHLDVYKRQECSRGHHQHTAQDDGGDGIIVDRPGRLRILSYAQDQMCIRDSSMPLPAVFSGQLYRAPGGGGGKTLRGENHCSGQRLSLIHISSRSSMVM